MNVFLLVVALASPVDAPKADMKEAAVASAAVAVESVVPAAATAEAAGTPLPLCEIAPAGESPEAKAKEVGVIPEPRKDGDCSLVGVYAEKRLLSSPWSVTRRLEAARIRGDTDEVKRMEALLEEAVDEALEAEGTGQGDGD